MTAGALKVVARKPPPRPLAERNTARRQGDARQLREHRDARPMPSIGDEVEITTFPFRIDKIVRVARVLEQRDQDRFEIVDEDGINRLIHRGRATWGGWWAQPRLEDEQ